MSAPESAPLSPEAEADFLQILLYSLVTWGERQMDAYSAKLEQALATIAENPEIGRPREDLRPGLRSLRVEHHVM